MSEYVIMPKADYTAACNAIRTKTGKADLIKSGDMEGEILGITLGGGSSADVRYVTFMNDDGTVELGKKAVATGDDCADPIARGVFSTPTKESTAQYTYTFYGWATTPNGAADSNWNKAVTEDRTVYANFVSAVRYYTIAYYDSDGTTVLETESLAYGTMPSYAPVKTGYFLSGWIPEISAVSGNASYVAQWAETAAITKNITWTDLPSFVAMTINNPGTVLNLSAPPSTQKDTIERYYNFPTATGHVQNTLYRTITQYAMDVDYTGNNVSLLGVAGGTYYVSSRIGGNVSEAKLTGMSLSKDCLIAYSPSSDLYAYTAFSSSYYRAYLSTGQYINVNTTGHPTCLEISKDNKYLVTADKYKGIQIFKISDRTNVATLDTNKTSIKGITISADGTKLVVSYSVAPYVVVYSLETFEKLYDLSAFITSTNLATFVGDFVVVAAGSTIRAFQMKDGSITEYFGIPAYSGGSVTKIATSHNCNYVAFYDGSQIEIWQNAQQT